MLISELASSSDVVLKPNESEKNHGTHLQQSCVEELVFYWWGFMLSLDLDARDMRAFFNTYLSWLCCGRMLGYHVDYLFTTTRLQVYMLIQ